MRTAADRRARALQYLATHNTLTLATLGPDGPWAAALFYVSDGFTVYWLSDPRARHSQDIARDPRVAVTIQEDYRDWRLIQGFQMEGTVERIGTLRAAAGPVRLYAAKYRFLRNWRTPPRALVKSLATARVYRFTPSRVLFIDNTRAFGYRAEVTPVR